MKKIIIQSKEEVYRKHKFNKVFNPKFTQGNCFKFYNYYISTNPMLPNCYRTFWGKAFQDESETMDFIPTAFLNKEAIILKKIIKDYNEENNYSK